MRYVPALDGLRAVAVGAVLLFHAHSPLAPGGFLGVSLFFTLSGFLITSLLLAEHESTGTIRLRSFYARRARRLLPAAIACLGLVLLGAGMWTVEARRDLSGDVVAALANVANWRFALSPEGYSDLFAGEASPVAHFWSLSIEEQLYVVLPLVLVVALRRGRRTLLVVTTLLLAASFAATLATTDHDLVYNGTHTRAAELLVGVVLAVAVSRPGARGAARRVSSIAGVGAGLLFVVLVAGVGLGDEWLYRGGFVAVAAVSGALILAVVRGAWPAPVLSLPPLVAIGKVSYGIYLFHWPVFLLLTPQRTGLEGVPLFGAQCLLTAAVTVVSYHGLEAPIRAGRRFASGRRAVLAGGVAAFALTAAALVFVPVPRPSATERLLALGDEADGSGLVVFGVTDAAGEIDGDVPAAPSADPALLPVAAAEEPRPARAGLRAAEPPAAGSAPARPDTDEPPLLLVIGSDGAPVPVLRRAGYRVADASLPACPLNVAPGDERCDGALARWAAQSRWLDAAGVVITAGAEENALSLQRVADVEDADDLSALSLLGETVFDRLVAAVDELLAAEVPTVVYFPEAIGSRFDGVLGELVATRPDLHGVVRDLAHLTDVVSADGFGARPVSGGDGSGTAGGRRGRSTEAPTRLLVLGDSTSLTLAQALGEAASGRAVVAWGGANGCPIARVAALRSSSSADWERRDCEPFDRKVPPLLRRFRPDAALLVVGPTELTEQRYPGVDGSHLPGDPEYVEFHLAEIDSLRRLLRRHGVELLIADAPSIEAGAFATPEMAQSWRVTALNEMFAVAASRWSDVGLVEYHDAVAAVEAVEGPIRSDGVHVDVAPLTVLVRETLLDEILGTARQLDSG